LTTQYFFTYLLLIFFTKIESG